MDAENDFFERMEIAIGTKIPDNLKLIFKQCDMRSEVVFSKLNEDYIASIEEFVRNELDADIIPEGHRLEDYLGIYKKCQHKFKFSSGHKIILNLIVDHCTKTSSRILTDGDLSTSIQIEKIDEDQIHNYDLIEKPQIEPFNMFNYIGSLMITVFNDAKRLTLSAWSWPSRHVATEKASHFNSTGDPNCTPTLFYVTPQQHRIFLDCIVHVHKPEFVNLLRNSLALSLRVDGSMDRTQDHNVYVMGHVVNRNATVSMVFIGFQIPEKGKSLGYFECMKNIVNNIWSWEECLALVSSLVTDGEPLNTGSEQGLWARFVKEVRSSTSRKQSIMAIWCVPHRFNLAWKDTCHDCSMIADIVAHATSLSSYFHKSGDRTEKLRNIALAKNFSKPLRYVTYFEVRWTEFVFDLLTVTLRNWRASMAYFESVEEEGLANRWLLYDRLHFLTFITDILELLKKFQKTFESNTISILHIQPKKRELIDHLQNAITSPVIGGWEELFLANVEQKIDGKYFYGHKLLENSRRSSTKYSCVFNVSTRSSIIKSLTLRLNQRLDYDINLQEDLAPLLEIKTTTSDHSLKLCYAAIVPDCDERTFYREYKIAADLLTGHKFINPLDTLQKLHTLVPNELPSLTLALARLIAAKPHSADVERLINEYNKLKATDRLSLAGLTLFNYLYVNVNMPTVDEFDPSSASQHWMAQKDRNPHEKSTRKAQEWFKDVFREAEEQKHKYSSRNKFF